jgi:hypothetical protein
MGECVPNWNFGECTRWAQIKDKQLKMKEAAAAGEEDVAAAEFTSILSPSNGAVQLISVR